MAQFRRRPPTVEAIRWEPEVSTEIPGWAIAAARAQMRQVIVEGAVEWQLVVGGAQARPGDWVVLLEDGGVCVCNPTEFAAKYEPVEQPEPEPAAPGEEEA